MSTNRMPGAPFAGRLTRRGMIAAGAVAIGGAPMIGKAMAAAKDTKSIVPARTIHQEEHFNAPPERLFEALLDARQFAAFTGLKAEIDRAVGGAFSLFNGVIVGRNVEIVANTRIVQAWRDAVWDAGFYSLVRFELKPRDVAGTVIVFDHTGIPAELAEARHLALGWHTHYWDPLRKYLAIPPL